jgi:YbbR domain-containing protein
VAAVPLPRAFRFVVRNWPLKLGAVALATVLYAGLVISQNARVVSVRVPIEPIRQPTGAFLLEQPPAVTSVRFYAPADVASRVGSTDFRATIDLSAVQPTSGGEPRTVAVTLEAIDDRVRIVDYEPRAVSVRLDPVQEKVVPVEVERGEVPAGIEIGEPQVDPAEVRVRGASSLVSRVARAVAVVTVQENAINVDQDVDLEAVDERGEAVAPVDLEPSSARVRIQVLTRSVTRSVPVSVSAVGVPATGYSVRSVTATPVVVTVSGPSETVGGLATVPTATIDLAGRTTSLVTPAELAPPEGVAIVGATSVEVRIEIAADEGSRTYPVGLTLQDARADRTYTLSTNQVNVTLGGSVADLAALDAGGLSATVNVGDLEPGERAVDVAFSAPSGLGLVSIEPTQIEVVVGVPPSPSPTPPPQTAPPQTAPPSP